MNHRSFAGRFGAWIVQAVLVLLIFTCAVAVIGGVAYLVYAIAANASDDVRVGALSALGAVGVIVAGRWFENRARIRERRQDTIKPTYERMMELFFEVAKDPENADNPDIVSRMLEVQREILLFGSEKVVAAYNNWLGRKLTEKDEAYATLKPWAEMMLAMRHDVGTSSSDVTELDLIRIFLVDDEDN